MRDVLKGWAVAFLRFAVQALPACFFSLSVQLFLNDHHLFD